MTLFFFLLMAILMFVNGLTNLLAPKLGWFISYGWRYKNAEPSNFSLVIIRISGLFFIVFSIFMITHVFL